MSQSSALDPVVTRSGDTQALTPGAALNESSALQPKITRSGSGAQTVTPDPAR